jgi:hypothetical protein
MADTVALLKRRQLLYLIEMRLPQTYMPPRLSRQPVAELRNVVRRAIRDGNLPADRVYQMAQFAPMREG